MPSQPTEKFLKEKETCLEHFHSWSEQDQIDFVEELLQGMCHYQHGTVNAFLKPMLQRDFISLLPKKGLDHVAEKIIGIKTPSSKMKSKLTQQVSSSMLVPFFCPIANYPCPGLVLKSSTHHNS